MRWLIQCFQQDTAPTGALTDILLKVGGYIYGIKTSNSNHSLGLLIFLWWVLFRGYPPTSNLIENIAYPIPHPLSLLPWDQGLVKVIIRMHYSTEIRRTKILESRWACVPSKMPGSNNFLSFYSIILTLGTKKNLSFSKIFFEILAFLARNDVKNLAPNFSFANMGYLMLLFERSFHKGLKTGKKLDMSIQSKDITFKNLNFPPFCY